MIELAPRNKTGLLVKSPILLAAGVIGCGDPVPASLKGVGIGAAVTGPITRSSRRGSLPPRLAEATGGFVLSTDLQNRGIAQTLKRCTRYWSKLPYPVVGQLADRDLDSLRHVAMQMETSGSFAGLELLVHPDAGADEVSTLVGAVIANSELPLWVKLPFGGAHLAEAAVSAGADALVVAQPPIGRVVHGDWLYATHSENDTDWKQLGDSTQFVTGPLFGPSMGPLILQMLAQVKSKVLMDTPLIVCGGIYRWDDVSRALSTGARAVQVDGIAWIEPGAVDELFAQWQAASQSSGVQ